MGRPPLTIGTAGAIKTTEDPAGGFRSRAYVRDPDGRRREVSRWRKTKASAERAVTAALKDRQHAAAAGDVTGDTRLSKILEQYLAGIDESNRAANTKRLYRSTVDNHIEPALGELRLREMTVPRVDAALRAIRDRAGHGTAKTARSVLSGALGLAVRLGAMPANPIREVSTLAGEPKTVRALTRDEEDRVRDAPRSSPRAIDLDLPDLIDWMLGTGMRIGEACAIRERALDGRLLLDLDAGTVEINATVVRVQGVGLVVQERTKSDAGWRVLALPDDLVEMLRRRRLELRLAGPDVVRVFDARGQIHEARDPGLVFCSPRGAVRDPSNTQGDLREILDAIDRPDDEPAGPFAWVTSHVFRKTVATRLDDAGSMSARQIADVLGHKHPSMTQDVYMGRKVVSADAARILARPGRTAA